MTQSLTYSCSECKGYGYKVPVCEACVSTLKARIQELEAQLGWQDIKDAPRDGAPIDVYTANSEFPMRHVDVSFREPSDSEFWVHGSDEPDPKKGEIGPERVWIDNHGWPLTGDNEPTHWRLRPTPPPTRGGAANLNEIYSDFISRQEPLGEEFTDVLNDREKLYEMDPETKETE